MELTKSRAARHAKNTPFRDYQNGTRAEGMSPTLARLIARPVFDSVDGDEDGPYQTENRSCSCGPGSENRLGGALCREEDLLNTVMRNARNHVERTGTAISTRDWGAEERAGD